MDKEIWPNFFIVGVRKGGTTSLYRYLTKVPGIYMPTNKEPSFFSSVGYPKDTRGIVREQSEYLRLFKEAKDATAIGEASTSYLWEKGTAQRIHDAIPDARIIIILRNPIERAFSHYLMNVSAGLQPLSFYDALRKDYNEPAKGLGTSILYVELGLYSEQVKRYLDLFGKDRVKVLIFEEFIQNPIDQMRDVLKFLGINAEPPENVGTVYNPFYVPRNSFTQAILKNKKMYELSRFLPAPRLKSLVYYKLLGKNTEKPRVPHDARVFLEEIYRDDVAKLKSILERPVPWPLN